MRKKKSREEPTLANPARVGHPTVVFVNAEVISCGSISIVWRRERKDMPPAANIIGGVGFGGRATAKRVGSDYARFAGNDGSGSKYFYGFPLGKAFKGGGGLEGGNAKVFAEANCLKVLISVIISLVNK